MERNYTKDYENFSIRLERILVPVGPGESLAADWLLILTVAARGMNRQLSIPMKELGRLDLERRTDCVYASPKEQKQVSQDLRELVVQAKSDPEAVIRYPARFGWSRIPERIFAAGKDLLPDGGRHPAQPYMELCGEPVRLAAPPESMRQDVISSFVRSLCEHPEYRIPVFAYTLMSALRSLWSEADLPFAGTLYIVGKSGTGKSTLAKNFCQLYDDGCGGIADCYDAKSTVSSMERVLSRVRDRTVLYDDICCSSDRSDQRKRRDSATTLLRFVANEMGRTKQNGKKVSHSTCTAGLVITAEFPLSEVSELTRCILVHVKEPRIGGTAQNREFASAALRGYLSWFAEHGEQELEDLRRNRKHIMTPPKQGQERLWGSVMQLNWCMESFLRFLKDAQGSSGDALSPGFVRRIFYELLQEEWRFIDARQRRQLPLEHHIAQGITSRQIPGICHKGAYCVRFEHLVRCLQRCGVDAAVSDRRISQYLRGKGLAFTDRSGRLTKKLDGKRYVFLNLRRLGIDEQKLAQPDVLVIRNSH